MRYVIGVDGGQTSTKAALLDEEGRVLGLGHGGPANHIHEPGGVERVRASLHGAVASARYHAGLPDVPIACAFLGMTGLVPDMEGICRPAVPAAEILLGHDTLIALYSVTLGGPGAVVIAGTGSAVFGRTADGRTASTGGWGYLMGDEGSGYWIAVRALNACTRAHDGRGPQTAILPEVLSQSGSANLRELHGLIYSGALARPEIAALASGVARAADAGDRLARSLLAAAGRELGVQAAKVARALWPGQESVAVGMVGGVFRAGRWVAEPLAAALRRQAPAAVPTPPRLPACLAAGLLALQRIGVQTDGPVAARVVAAVADGTAGAGV